MKAISLTIAALGLALTTLSAQKQIEFGIKAGVNLASMYGSSETDADGNKLESHSIGFRILAGGYARIRLANRFSVQPEIMYIQKGGGYKYDGLGFDRLVTGTTGRRKMTLNTTLNCMEIPVMFNYEIVKNKFELSVGPSLGFIIGAAAAGNTRYYDDATVRGRYYTATGLYSNAIEYDLQYAYGKDDAGATATISGTGLSTTTQDVVVNGNSINTPTLLGAYYDYSVDEVNEKGKYYNLLDLGLNAGFTWRATGSLRVGVRFQYSMLDITNNAYDFSLQTRNTTGTALQQGRGVPRADKDGNIGVQLSLGFGF